MPAYLGPLFDALRQFGPEGNALAAKYNLENRLLTFVSVGGIYDSGDWFVMGEWGTVDFDSVLGKKSAWYASSGYRLAKFTPYLTYAQAKASDLSDPGLTVAALPPYLQGPASALNGALNQVLSSKPVQTSISAGARWHFMKNTDLKLQFDRIRLRAGSAGVLINVQPNFQPGSTVNVFSATVDFVF